MQKINDSIFSDLCFIAMLVCYMFPAQLISKYIQKKTDFEMYLFLRLLCYMIN